jgi:hypothetical protein
MINTPVSPAKHYLWTGLTIVLLALAAAVYFHGIRGNLPYHLDVDEPVFYISATQVRQSGWSQIKPNYPPLRFFEMAGEQIVADVLAGGQSLPIVYAIYGRTGSAFAALVLLALIFRLGRELHSPLAGFYATGLLAFDRQMSAFSHLARADTWAWMLGTGAVLYSLRLMRQPRTQMWATVGGLSICALLAKYSILPLLILPGHLFSRRYLRYPIVRWCIGIATAVAVIAVIGLTVYFRRDPDAWRLRLSDINLEFILDDEFQPLENFTASANALRSGASDLWLATPLSLAAALALGQHRELSRYALTTVTLLAITILVTLILSGVRDFRYYDGYQIILICAVFGGLGLALLADRWKLIGLTLTSIMVATLATPKAVAAWQFGNDFTRPHTLAQLGDWFIQNVPEGARIVVETATPFNAYAGFPGRSIYHQLTVNSIFEEPVDSYRQRGYEYLIWNSIKGRDTLNELLSPENQTRLNGAHRALQLTSGAQGQGPDIVVFRLEPLPHQTKLAWFSPAISFRGYDLNEDTFQPGEEVRLMLYWMSAEPTAAKYIVFVHMLDPATGTLVVGQDGPPDYGNTPTWKWQGDMQFIRDQRIFTIPPDAQPGVYTLRIGMYDADIKARVQVLDLDYQPMGDGITLQEIRVQQ